MVKIQKQLKSANVQERVKLVIQDLEDPLARLARMVHLVNVDFPVCEVKKEISAMLVQLVNGV